MEILTIKNLSFSYPNCGSSTLSDISFSVTRGDFVIVCGETGSGKSTLLRMLKPQLTPLGNLTGNILLKDTPIEKVPDCDSASGIGFVMQNPELQIVTDKVWHELAFGLENLGVKQELIRRRVSEIACYFGIEDWFMKDVSELSGGQKQLLNLASVMVMQPEILLLDEPTSQLDPIAARDFIQTIARVNRELGVTVIMTEHHLEEVMPLADRMLMLREGKSSFFGAPREYVAEQVGTEISQDLPAAVRLYAALPEKEGTCPLTVSEGRHYLEDNYRNGVREIEREEYRHEERKILEFRDVFFRYQREQQDVLNGLSFTVYEKKIFCLLGGNGSGKSTSLMCAAGLLTPYAGTITVNGKNIKKYRGQELYKECISMLPQDVQTIFLRNTVAEELEDVKADIESFPYDLSPLLARHPYDLSGGQQQMVALSKVLATKPRILLLDEPTKGLDAASRKMVTDVLRELRNTGMTIVLVTHDVEFAAETADRCAMLFRGEVVSSGTPAEFFCGNSFYTTAFHRMTRGFYDGAVTLTDVVDLCNRNGRNN